MGYSLKLPALGASSSSSPYDDVAWVNPTNIYSNNTVYATVTDAAFDTNAYTQLLKATNFGFAVPTGSTVTGVTVEIEAASTAGSAEYALVQLLNDSGALFGDNRASDNGALAVSSVRYDTFGTSTSVWGASLTPAIVNDADFGVALSVKALSDNTTLRCDYISMTVWWYTEYSTLNVDSAIAVPEEPISAPFSIELSALENFSRVLVPRDFGTTLASYETVQTRRTVGQLWPRGK